MPTDNLTDLKTPPACIADFCLIPLGTPTASVSQQIAQVQRLLKKSGLVYEMRSAGTTVGELCLSRCVVCVCFFWDIYVSRDVEVSC